MSAAAPTVPEVTFFNPWHVLRDLGETVKLEWHDGGVMGRTKHSTRTISLRRGMTPAERRSTIAHELLHLDRGPVTRGMTPRDEEQVRRETARTLLPDIKVVGEAIAWALCEEECADELDVDVMVLRYRLKNLHPAERHYLRRRLEEED